MEKETGEGVLLASAPLHGAVVVERGQGGDAAEPAVGARRENQSWEGSGGLPVGVGRECES